MDFENFLQPLNSSAIALKKRIAELKNDLFLVEEQTRVFELKLRLALENELIEVQELTVLYKKWQKFKKEKRLAQKQKGKNFEASTKPKIVEKNLIQLLQKANEQKEKKKWYREAMLCVHPDTFSMDDANLDAATETTSKLIEIYKNGTLEELKAFHAFVVKGHFLEASNKDNLGDDQTTAYLQIELNKLIVLLKQAKEKHTYIVLCTYKNPMTFLDELKAYYDDRIFKLKKRTRKAF